MAKYIGTYTNSGAVQTALDTQELSRPFVAYTTDDDKVYYGPELELAEVGDIVVYATGDTLLHYIKQADYNTTAYPTAAYVPVGVVAHEQYSNLSGKDKITFLGLNWLDANKPDTGNENRVTPSWGKTAALSGLTRTGDINVANNDLNGKGNTEVVLIHATAQTNWKTDSAITWSNSDGEYPLFECAWRYNTSGTVQGDWFVPACGEINYIVSSNDYKTAINTSLSLIGAAQYDFNNRLGTSTGGGQDFMAWLFRDGAGQTATVYGGIYWGVRPFCSKLMTRI